MAAAGDRALRAVLDVQGPIRRLAATVEAAVAEQAAYVQRAAESERAGEWNTEVRCRAAGRSRATIYPTPAIFVLPCTAA